MFNILLLLFCVSAIANVFLLRAWIKDLEDTIEVLNLADEAIEVLRARLEEVKND